MFERWREFRARQREALRASNHPHEAELRATTETSDATGPGPGGEHTSRGGNVVSDLLTGLVGGSGSDEPEDEEGTDEGAHHGDGEPDQRPARGRGAKSRRRDYGQVGRPLNRQSPFYVGFVGALGVLVAFGLWQLISRTTTTITVVVVAFFLALALNPLVEFLVRHRFNRSAAVGAVFAGVLLVFVLLSLLVVPPVVEQSTALANNAPNWVTQVLGSDVVRDLDKSYDIVDKVEDEFNKRITDGSFVGSILGGVFGAGRALVSGVFQTFTILILSLFLLASFPRVKQAAFAMIPVSRRPRVEPLVEEMMRRTGSYAIGQIAVASVNAILSWVLMLVVGIPYAAVLAVVVGFLGLIPMVGATFGAALVCLVAVFEDPQKALIALIYFVVYQQVENYLIAPRIMQRTVSVPGAVTIVAALAGGTLLGVLGALLAIPIAAGLLLLYEEVLLPRQQRS